MEDAPSLLKIPKSECPDIWIRLPQKKTNGPNHGPAWKTQSFFLNEICRVILWQDLWESQFEKVQLEHGWAKVPNWECLFVHREKTILVCVCGRHKTGWKETKSWPNVESTHERRWFGRTNILPWPRLFGLHSTRVRNKLRYCRQLQIYVRIQDLCWSKRKATFLWESWRKHFLMVLWYGRSCKEMRGNIFELANKTTSQFYKVATPCIDDHQYKEEKMGSGGELSTVCSQIVLTCLYLARIGRPDILWSVKKFARAVTKWTRGCEKGLARFISYIHHTSEFKHYCHMGNTEPQCRLGLFQDSDFAGDVEDSKSTSGWIQCILGSHTFVPISWMCKKQTPVSHSSTDSEIISLDAGLHMDGIPALDLWDLVIEVLHSSFNQTRKPKETVQGDLLRNKPSSKKHTNSQTKTQVQYNDLELSNVDCVSSNVKSSHFGAMLYIFEDNEAVIKMIIKGRSPTMRRVSRTHRVALDWLLSRIDLDPKGSNQIHWHQKKTTRRHNDKGQLHKWWVEPSSASL